MSGIGRMVCEHIYFRFGISKSPNVYYVLVPEKEIVISVALYINAL